MPFPIYFDEDSMRTLVRRSLERLGWRCLSTLDADNGSRSDAYQLDWASRNGWCIFTSNQKDFARLHREWSARGDRHGGLIILTNQGMPVAAVVDAMAAIGEAFTTQSIHGQILYLNNWT